MYAITDKQKAHDSLKGNNDHSDQLQQLKVRYDDIFQPPVGIPPHRDVEHGSDLKESSQPFSSRPYRYSYEQKNEIEKLKLEMLDSGVNRPSSSPFASPLLLVK